MHIEDRVRLTVKLRRLKYGETLNEAISEFYLADVGEQEAYVERLKLVDEKQLMEVVHEYVWAGRANFSWYLKTKWEKQGPMERDYFDLGKRESDWDQGYWENREGDSNNLGYSKIPGNGSGDEIDKEMTSEEEEEDEEGGGDKEAETDEEEEYDPEDQKHQKAAADEHYHQTKHSSRNTQPAPIILRKA